MQRADGTASAKPAPRIVVAGAWLGTCSHVVRPHLCGCCRDNRSGYRGVKNISEVQHRDYDNSSLAVASLHCLYSVHGVRRRIFHYEVTKNISNW